MCAAEGGCFERRPHFGMIAAGRYCKLKRHVSVLTAFYVCACISYEQIGGAQSYCRSGMKKPTVAIGIKVCRVVPYFFVVGLPTALSKSVASRSPKSQVKQTWGGKSHSKQTIKAIGQFSGAIEPREQVKLACRGSDDPFSTGHWCFWSKTRGIRRGEEQGDGEGSTAGEKGRKG